jgi:hypothetical protein
MVGQGECLAGRPLPESRHNYRAGHDKRPLVNPILPMIMNIRGGHKGDQKVSLVVSRALLSHPQCPICILSEQKNTVRLLTLPYYSDRQLTSASSDSIKSDPRVSDIAAPVCHHTLKDQKWHIAETP